ncbi:hypothetical protein KQI85_00640 [Falcatimonas sp. MSJ-15]|uniref:hypothetical protein n=1 Tax=Falcatimonas sp. MSJ-15 TaxID=2841515 RepID=UPI001C0F717E|nr:hypothetical protein [Falcatimonas sp. MSJ-15]MBU5468882.1 hypothetical protein [Falcatimonas sp. MSJ-15]
MSKFYVANTDNKWLDAIIAVYNSGQVNFWQSPNPEFRALEQGELFLFKLHNKQGTNQQGQIVGGGYFVEYKKLTIPNAWNKYGKGNGFASQLAMQVGVQDKVQNNEIGCIILDKVFFFDNNACINAPANWKPTIQKGKTYTTDVDEAFKKSMKNDREIKEAKKHKTAQEIEKMAKAKAAAEVKIAENLLAKVKAIARIK